MTWIPMLLRPVAEKRPGGRRPDPRPDPGNGRESPSEPSSRTAHHRYGPARRGSPVRASRRTTTSWAPLSAALSIHWATFCTVSSRSSQTGEIWARATVIFPEDIGSPVTVHYPDHDGPGSLDPRRGFRSSVSDHRMFTSGVYFLTGQRAPSSVHPGRLMVRSKSSKIRRYSSVQDVGSTKPWFSTG